MANAQMAHALAHWRYHLNEWVVDYLKQEGYCTPEKVVERDEWKTSKRREYANEIVDHMERVGEVRKLYRDFKNETEHAHNKPVRRRGLAIAGYLLTSCRCPRSATGLAINGVKDGFQLEVWRTDMTDDWMSGNKPYLKYSHNNGFVVADPIVNVPREVCAQPCRTPGALTPEDLRLGPSSKRGRQGCAFLVCRP